MARTRSEASAHAAPPGGSAASRSSLPEVDWDSPALSARLRDAGLRPTTARRWIIALLGVQRVHPTVDELQRLLRAYDHEIRQATLYQSLARLSEAGVVSSFVDSHGLLRFDANVDAHHHLICTGCGRIDDLSPSMPEERRLGSIASDLARGHARWLLSDARLELRALCPECAAGR